MCEMIESAMLGERPRKPSSTYGPYMVPSNAVLEVGFDRRALGVSISSSQLMNSSGSSTARVDETTDRDRECALGSSRKVCREVGLDGDPSLMAKSCIEDIRD